MLLKGYVETIAFQRKIICAALFGWAATAIAFIYLGIGSDTNNYVRMAKAYINDPDASEGKVLDAWLAQMEA